MAINQSEPRPFGLMLRRPGDVANPDAEPGAPDEEEGIYLAPDFTERHLRVDTHAVSDPRRYVGGESDWALSLPHSCGEWEIGTGSREQVLSDARRLRDELDQAITALLAEEPLPEGPRYFVKVTARTGPAEVQPPAPWPPEGTVGVDVYAGDPPRLLGDAQTLMRKLSPSGPAFTLDLHALLTAETIRIDGIDYAVTGVERWGLPQVLSRAGADDAEIEAARARPDAAVPDGIKLQLARLLSGGGNE